MLPSLHTASVITKLLGHTGNAYLLLEVVGLCVGGKGSNYVAQADLTLKVLLPRLGLQTSTTHAFRCVPQTQPRFKVNYELLLMPGVRATANL